MVINDVKLLLKIKVMKVYYFIMLCLYILGVIGGIGYSIYNGAYPIAVGVVALGYMAFDKIKYYIQELSN